VLINAYLINEGMRAAFTDARTCAVPSIYPVLVGFLTVFLWIGLRTSDGGCCPDEPVGRVPTADRQGWVRR